MSISENISNIKWTIWEGVPIADQRKLRWIEDCIKFFKKNPDQWWTGISSGDSYIHVKKLNDSYVVTEYKPMRSAYIKRDPDDVDACRCTIEVLNQSGCKCGGV